MRTTDRDRAWPRGGLPAQLRRARLAAAIAQRGFVSVAEVARELGASEMTVRRDLDALQREGAVERAHGGAVPARAVAAVEPSFAARAQQNAGAKRAIAREAARLVSGREVIGLDVGSTLAALATLLSDRRGLAVVTNSLRAAAALSSGPSGAMPDVYMLGGQLRPNEGSLCGAIAQRQLADHYLHKAFIGAAGITDEGLFDHSVEETQVTMGYIRSAQEVIVLCDASKFGRRGFARVCGLHEVDRLITDAEPPAPLRAALERAGVAVTIAGVLAEAA